MNDGKEGQFQLVLTGIKGASRIPVTSAIANATQCGIASAKKMVDALSVLGVHQVVFVSPSMETLLNMNSQIMAAGGKCKIEAWTP